MVDGPYRENGINIIESRINLLLAESGSDYQLFNDATAGITENLIEVSSTGEALFESKSRQAIVNLMGPVTPEARIGLTWRTFYPSTPEGNDAFLDALKLHNLNNAPTLIAAKPNLAIHTSDTAVDVGYMPMDEFIASMSPARMRAEGIVPQLFKYLRTVLKHPTIESDRDAYYKTLTAESPVLIAMRTAYGIMGNCVRNDDRLLRQYMAVALQGGEDTTSQSFDTTKITDINTELEQ